MGAACGSADDATGSDEGFVVDSPADAIDADPGDGVCATEEGACTLRAAIQETNASGGGRIRIEPGLRITLELEGHGEDDAATGDLDITADVTIEGRGATIDADGIDRVLHIHAGTTTVSELTILGGDLTEITGSSTASWGDGGDGRDANRSRVMDFWGAGVLVEAGASLVGQGAVVRRNRAVGGGGLAALPGATVRLERSAVSHNVATRYGGGLLAVAAHLSFEAGAAIGNWIERPDGGVAGAGAFELVSSDVRLAAVTLSDNRGAAIAGIRARQVTDAELAEADVPADRSLRVPPRDRPAAGVELVDLTITNNQGTGLAVASKAVVTAHNTVVASQATGEDCSGTLTSVGFNLDSDGTCAFTDETDQRADPLLGPLEGEGVEAAHTPAPDSPLVGTGPPECGSSDQRGTARPVGTRCDRGALELTEPPADTTTTTSPAPPPTWRTDDDGRLRIGDSRNYLGITTGLSPRLRHSFSPAIGGACSAKEQGDLITPVSDQNFDRSGQGPPRFEHCVPGEGQVVANAHHDPEGYRFAVELPGGDGPPARLRIDASSLAHCPTGGAGTGSVFFSDTGGRRDPPQVTRITVRADVGTQGERPSLYGPVDIVPVDDDNCRPHPGNEWMELVDVIAEPGDRFVIQVQAPLGERTDLEEGGNAFALRAYTGESFTPCTSDYRSREYEPDCPAVYAIGALSMFAGFPPGTMPGASTSTVPAAQTFAAHAGRALVIELWDFAEGARTAELIDPNGDPIPFTLDIACQDGTYPADSDLPCEGEYEPEGGYGPFEVSAIEAVAQPVNCVHAPGPRSLSCHRTNGRLLRLRVALDGTNAGDPIGYWTLRIAATPLDRFTVRARVE